MQTMMCTEQSRLLLNPTELEQLYGISKHTQASWRSTNRYGFGRLAIRVGGSVRYRRAELESWLESRRCVSDQAQPDAA